MRRHLALIACAALALAGAGVLALKRTRRA